MAKKIKDSGSRRKVDTGCVRDAEENKGRFDLLPVYAIQRLALHFEKGAKKYDDRNWEKGMPLSWFLDSGIRHAFKELAGWTDEPHVEACIWNMVCYLETKKRIAEGILPKDLNNMHEVWKNTPKNWEDLDEKLRYVMEGMLPKGKK